jgi:hypothetical protein
MSGTLKLCCAFVACVDTLSGYSVLATRKDLLTNVIVSDKNKRKGIYTVKFSKGGKVRVALGCCCAERLLYFVAAVAISAH